MPSIAATISAFSHRFLLHADKFIPNTLRESRVNRVRLLHLTLLVSVLCLTLLVQAQAGKMNKEMAKEPRASASANNGDRRLLSPAMGSRIIVPAASQAVGFGNAWLMEHFGVSDDGYSIRPAEQMVSSLAAP